MVCQQTNKMLSRHYLLHTIESLGDIELNEFVFGWLGIVKFGMSYQFISLASRMSI